MFITSSNVLSIRATDDEVSSSTDILSETPASASSSKPVPATTSVSISTRAPASAAFSAHASTATANSSHPAGTATSLVSTSVLPALLSALLLVLGLLLWYLWRTRGRTVVGLSPHPLMLPPRPAAASTPSTLVFRRRNSGSERSHAALGKGGLRLVNPPSTVDRSSVSLFRSSATVVGFD